MNWLIVLGYRASSDNQHYVRRAIDEDWMNANDASGRTGLAGESDQRTIAQIKTDSVISELKKWGYKDGDSRENAAAEARAEAANPLGRIVPVSSLAHCRFRIEVLEPLLSYAKSNDSIRPRSKSKSPIACLPYRPKGRLAWAVQNFFDSSSISESRPVLVALDSALSRLTLLCLQPVSGRELTSESGCTTYFQQQKCNSRCA